MACPMCGDETVQTYRPFCSRRCADLDLARWVRGDYAIPGPDGDPDVPDLDDAGGDPPRHH